MMIYFSDVVVLLLQSVFSRDIYDILLKNISLQFINSMEETVMHYCQEAFNAMLFRS